MNAIARLDSKNGMVLTEEESRNKSLKEGRCEFCENPLFKVKRHKFNPLKVVKIPLTVPGEVDNGKCLLCVPSKGAIQKKKNIASHPKMRGNSTKQKASRSMNLDNESSDRPRSGGDRPRSSDDRRRGGDDRRRGERKHSNDHDDHKRPSDLNKAGKLASRPKSKEIDNRTMEQVKEDMKEQSRSKGKDSRGAERKRSPSPTHSVDNRRRSSDDDRRRRERRTGSRDHDSSVRADDRRREKPKDRHHDSHDDRRRGERKDYSNNDGEHRARARDRGAASSNDHSMSRGSDDNRTMVQIKHSMKGAIKELSARGFKAASKSKSRERSPPRERSRTERRDRDYSPDHSKHTRERSPPRDNRSRNEERSRDYRTDSPPAPRRSSVTRTLDDVHVIIMKMFAEDSPSALKELCKDLYDAMGTRAIKIEVIMGGGMLVLFNIISGEHIANESLQDEALYVILDLMQIADEAIIQDLNFAEAVTNLMVCHPCSPYIQESAVGILRNLSDRSDAYTRIIANQGGEDIIKSVVQNHNSRTLSRHADALLYNLSHIRY